MGACCNRPISTEEEFFQSFWDSVHIQKLTAEQLMDKVSQLQSITIEQFLADFENKIIESVFYSDQFKTIVDFFIYNSLSTISLFKVFAIFFSLLLMCKIQKQEDFNETFIKFFKFCTKFEDLKNYNLNDKSLIKEFVIFYVHLVSTQTYKAFMNNYEGKSFDRTRVEYNSIFSQRNRDSFVEELFQTYEKIPFSLYKFSIDNLKKLEQANIRKKLEEIEEIYKKEKSGKN